MTTSLLMPHSGLVSRLALTVSLSLFLTACHDSGGSPSSTSPSTPTPPTTPVTSACVDNPFGSQSLYMRGGMNSWSAADTYKFTYVCNHFELVTNLTGSQTFKIADSQWSTNADFGGGSASQVTADQALTLALQGANLNFTFTGVNKIILDVSKSTTTPTLTIQQCPDSPLGDTAIYLRGDMNSWATSNQYRFTYSCDAYYLNVADTGTFNFKIGDAGWTGKSSFGAASAGSSTLTYGETANLTRDVDNGGTSSNLSFKFTGANTAKLTLDSTGANPTLTIGDQYFTQTETFPVTDPVALSMAFDSRNTANKQPFGAITEGNSIQYNVTAKTGVDSVDLVIENHTMEGNQNNLTYTEVARIPLTKSTSGDQDTWSGAYTYATKGVYGYYFEYHIGSETYVYQNNNDSVYQTTEKGTDGIGAVGFKPTDTSNIRRYRQTVYLSSFQVPSWAQDAVYYQIFPERFRNGDATNDPVVGKDTYLGGAIEFHTNWNDKPYVPGDGTSDSTYNNDFFGGDIQGIIDELDYLSDLGVNTLYITPIFEAGSNHKYDTANYMKVDSHFGDTALFAKLNASAKAKGIRVVLDASFHHTGSDSIYFDRYSRYPEVGAFEGGAPNPASPYFSWFTFYTDQTNPDKMYPGWDASMPDLLVDNQGVRDYLYGNSDSVTKYWLGQGISGWRMDVAPWIDDDFWRNWRSAVKATDANAVTIAETWFDSSKFFLGDEFDSTMNYIFHDAVLDFANGGNASTVYKNLEMLREHYPNQALHALMNLISSHDVPRALYNLGDVSSSTDAATVMLAKQRLFLATLFQMSYPGSPSIYYGDEVGVTGGADPMNRATYPWQDKGGAPDTALLTKFKQLVNMRKSYDILRQGSLEAPLYTDSHTLVLLRKLNGQNAIIALNNDSNAESVSLTLPATLAGTYSDVLNGGAAVVDASGNVTLTIPALSGCVLISQ